MIGASLPTALQRDGFKVGRYQHRYRLAASGRTDRDQSAAGERLIRVMVDSDQLGEPTEHHQQGAQRQHQRSAQFRTPVDRGTYAARRTMFMASQPLLISLVPTKPRARCAKRA